MSNRNIVIEPDPILRKKSEPLEEVNNDLRKLMDEMLETMYEAPGIGLAAVQVGVLKRVIVIDLSKKDEKKNPIFIINPQLTFKSDDLVSYEEGCLSIPSQFAEVKRPNKCNIKYLDIEGNEKEIKAEGLLSTCIQHEIDHLNGILFIDHLSKLKKDLIIKKANKQKKEIDRVIV